MGTVERYNSGYSGGVWVRWMGTVGTVEGVRGYGERVVVEYRCEEGRYT